PDDLRSQVWCHATTARTASRRRTHCLQDTSRWVWTTSDAHHDAELGRMWLLSKTFAGQAARRSRARSVAGAAGLRAVIIGQRNASAASSAAANTSRPRQKSSARRAAAPADSTPTIVISSGRSRGAATSAGEREVTAPIAGGALVLACVVASGAPVG